MNIIDGKALSQEIKDDIQREVESIRQQGGKIPHLAAVIVGDDPASQTYVKNKVLSCEKIGFKSTLIQQEADISEDESRRSSRRWQRLAPP